MPQGSAIYGGNISGISWTTNNITRNYRFSYDGLSRITKANYSGPGNFYSSYQYDKHGNITKLSRFGNTDSGNYSITDLVSFYYNGNQLKKADDAAIQIFNNLSADFKNYADADVEYSYNKNGALTKDLNKGITDIQYNLLNLPSEINISTPFTVGCTKYLYAANGMKLRVSHNNDPGLLNIPLMGTDQYYRSNLSDGSVTDFVGNLVYEDNTLKRILIDGGYIENSTYYFFLTDHLGSIRVVADASGSVVQRNHFYPFGLSFADNENPETQPYKFNGKELDLFHGLNWYDYLARGMDTAAGRFTAIDPLCEKYFALSPYVFCANNPVNYIDPDGMDWYEANNKEIIWTNYTSQKELDDNKIEGKYLGQAYVVFNGSKDEKLGSGNNFFGEDAKLSEITVYEPQGASDIQQYQGYSMSSDPSLFGVVAEGTYIVNRLNPNDRKGPYQSEWTLNNRGKVPANGNINPAHPERNPGYLTGVFIHRPNNNGFAGTYLNKKTNKISGISEGCLLISPKQWDKFNAQLNNIKNFRLQLIRK